MRLDEAIPSGGPLRVIAVALLFLCCSHLAVKDFFPNPVFWVIGASLIVAVGVFWLVAWKDHFGLCLALFSSCHFAFADNQGSIWSYVVVAILIIGALLGKWQTVRISSAPFFFNLLIFILMVHQVAGTALNSYSPISNLQATVVSLSHVLAFYFCSSQTIAANNIKKFLTIWFFLGAWAFLIGLNQHYHWVITSSPLLPQMYRFEGILTNAPLGSFGNSELYGEYFCILFSIALIVLSYRTEFKRVGIGPIWPGLMALMAIGAMILSSSRSVILLAVAVSLYFGVSFLAFSSSVQNLKRVLVFISFMFAAGLMILLAGSLFSTGSLMKKFSELTPEKMELATIGSGKTINRSGAFAAAFRRLESQSFMIGYGYSTPENNLASMGLGKRSADYHSLYLSLPIFYGWLGAASYLLLVFGTGLRSYIWHFRTRKLGSPLSALALGFAIIWGVFMLNEYKIGATRNHTYFLLTWMLLGLTHAIVNGLRREKEPAGAPNQTASAYHAAAPFPLTIGLLKNLGDNQGMRHPL